MKRIIAVCLLSCLLLSSIGVFAGCAGKYKVDLAEYKVIYSVSANSSVQSRIYDFFKNAGKKMDFKLRGSKDAAVTPTAHEILVGYTNRPESEKALKKIEGDGFIITVINDKIVIVGTTDFLTCRGLDYFEKVYLSGEGTVSSQMTIMHHVEEMEMMDLDIAYSMIFAQGLDDKAGCEYGSDYRTDGENPDAYDYPVVAAYQVRKDLLDLYKSVSTAIPVVHDGSPDISDNAIYFGSTNADITAELHANFDVNTYGYTIQNGRIAVGGLNTNMLRESVSAFRDMMRNSICEINGQSVIRIPKNYTFTDTKLSLWKIDFPRPDGLQLSGSVDVADNSVEFYYDGDNISAEAYHAYCETLKNAGYRVYFQNTIGENLYTTFVNEEVDTTLHVVYAAFAYAKEQGVQLFSPCIRVISAPLSSVNLIKEEWLDRSAQTYTKVTETMITSMRLDHSAGNWGNAYIITLEDGSFIVIDGGASISSKDRDRMWSVLSDLYQKCFGALPDGEHPIRIAAWYMTHGHADHFENFFAFCEKYGKSVILETLIANFPSNEEGYNSYDPNYKVRDSLVLLSSYLKEGVTYYKVHAGQKFFVRNIELEVLYTHEEMYPQTIELFNDTSTVIRMGIYSTDGKGIPADAKPVETAIWLGDLHLRGSKNLRAMFGDLLKSDMVQLAHHGLNGCEWELYQLIAPACVWWPTNGPNMYWQGNYAGYDHYCFYTDYMVFNHLESVEYIISNDGFNTTVTVTSDGAVYDLTGPYAIYNAYDNVYKDVDRINELTFQHPNKYMIKFNR